jgi:hypothetical protein
MSNKKATNMKYKKKTAKDLVLSSFSGIDTDGYSHPAVSREGIHASESQNLRITQEGSLLKREGFKLLSSAPSSIRAIWSGNIEGILRSYILCKDTLYSLDVESGNYTKIGNVDTSSGNAHMIYYVDSIYIFDGSYIYRLKNDEISLDFGYAPLIADNWTNTFLGTINEPRNAICNFARYTYTVSSVVTPVLRTAYKVASVKAAFVNGEPIDLSRCAPTDFTEAVTVQDLKEGDRVELHVCLEDDSTVYKELASSIGGMVYGKMTDSVMLLHTSDKNRIYFSRIVDYSSLKASDTAFSGGSLYIPFDNIKTVGDGRYGISAIYRHYDRLLVFTEGETWMADTDFADTKDILPTMTINAYVGSPSLYGVCMAENTPLSVSRDGIYLFTTDTDTFDECNAQRISAPVDHLIKNFLPNTACTLTDRKRREVFITMKDSEGKALWLFYNTALRTFYRFLCPAADKLLYVGNKVGFIQGEKIYVFDDTLSVDLPNGENGENELIEGYYVTNIHDLGSHDIKHISSISASYDLTDGKIKLGMECDGEKQLSATLYPKEDHSHLTYKHRISSGRIKTVRLVAIFTGCGRQSLHGITLEVR